MTKGQLITLWVFGILAWIVSFFDAISDNPAVLSGILLLFIPFALVWITLGWKKKQKIIK